MACNDSREGNFHNFGYSLGWGYDKVGDEDVVEDVADEGYYTVVDAVDDNLVDYNYGSFLIACTFSCCNCLQSQTAYKYEGLVDLVSHDYSY